jgi:NitT/TauT family transport system ATP-binding protein
MLNQSIDQSASSEVAVSLNNITRTFPTTDGSVAGIKNVSLTVGRGEFVCIVGPSGCGKSTVLNLIAGLVFPESGSLSFGSELGKQIASHRIGYMLARDSLLPWRTAQANVELALEVNTSQPVSKIKRQKIATELLNRVGLSGFHKHYPRQLSHGMRQRVAVARTFACDPGIFLMDEPFGALDVQTRRDMHEQFVRLWLADRKTAIFVTHDLTEALILGDRVLVMNGKPGQLVADYAVDIPREERMGEGFVAPRLFELQERLWKDLRRHSVKQKALV